MNAQVQTVYRDLNRNFGSSASSELLFGKDAINQGLFNLFNTLPGEASPIFEPEFGSALPQLIFEPMDDITSMRMESAVFQAINRWEPRILVDVGQSSITPNYQNQQFQIRLVYSIRATGETVSAKFNLSPLTKRARARPFSTLEKHISLHRIGWPGIYQFCVVDGIVLKASSTGSNSWDAIPDWGSFLSWEQGVSDVMIYTTIVDNHSEVPRRIEAVFSDTRPQSVLVELSVSSDGATFSAYSSLPTTSVSSRFLQFRVTVTVTPGTPMQLNRGDLYFYV